MSDTTHESRISKAPGGPGSEPHWSPAAKSGVGCALGAQSRVWFTLARGIVDEVHHPWLDHAAIKSLGLIVTGPANFFSEEQLDCATDTRCATPGVPAFHVLNQCIHGRYRIAKDVLADPKRDVLLQRVCFTPLAGSLADFRLFASLAPRLGDQGHDNTGWAGTFKTSEMLFVQRESHALALATTSAWITRAAGFAGEASDPLDALHSRGHLGGCCSMAEHGHISLAGEIDLQRCGGKFLLAMGFGRSPEAAGLVAVLSMHDDFDAAWNEYVEQWQAWQRDLAVLDYKNPEQNNLERQQRARPDRSRPRPMGLDVADQTGMYRTSTMVLRVHRSKQFAGGGIASLSVPWGEVRGDDDSGGYHVAWPRDLVEAASGLMAAGDETQALGVLHFLRATQQPGGGWAQDLWLDGATHGPGEQLDEAALPVLLLDLAREESIVNDAQLEAFWPMVRGAAGCIVRRGPSTGEDRWENAPGLSTFTLATEIAALLIASRLARRFGESRLASCFEETADLWNSSIEAWTYVTGTPTARRIGVQGYYVRIAPSPGMRTLLRNPSAMPEKSAGGLPASEVVSPDALALVRFGLRAPDDPRILNTVKVIDAVNRVETPAGPCWHRYDGDYYGETDDGGAFHGIENEPGNHGRAWPLLTGERAHYELSAGHFEKAARLLSTMGGFASQIGLIPEQVWDSDDLPAKDLYRGRASGSAMPLAWAHGEYVKLLRSLRDKKVFDRPNDTFERYVEQRIGSDLFLWRFDHQEEYCPARSRVRIEVLAPAVVHFSTDRWASSHDLPTRDTGIGLHTADLPTSHMAPGDLLIFTFRWSAAGDRWEGRNFKITIDAPRTSPPHRQKPPEKTGGSRARSAVEVHQ